MRTHLETKYDLLIECCKLSPDDEFIASLINKIDNWDEIINSAYMHGVFPLVYQVLKKFLENNKPLLSQFKYVNLEIAQSNLQMTAELIKLTKLLDKENIPLIGIKGPVLSALLYKDITKRQFSDIDVLLHQEDMHRAVVMLESIGYRSEFSSDFLKNEMLLKVDKDFAISTPDEKINIEFHWKLFSNPQMSKSRIVLFDVENVDIDIHNTHIRTLATDIQLLYLLVHGSKHYWERLEWICDIDRLIRQNSMIDWTVLMERARTMEIEGMVYLGLMISHDLLNTPLHEKILQRISELAVLEKSKKSIICDIRHDKIIEGHSEHVDLKNLYHLSLINETKWKLIKEYLSIFFAIKKWDVFVINLPKRVHWLYYFIRYYRIIKENIFIRK